MSVSVLPVTFYVMLFFLFKIKDENISLIACVNTLDLLTLLFYDVLNSPRVRLELDALNDCFSCRVYLGN